MNSADVSARELAAWIGVNDRSVRDLAQRGVIEKTSKGKYPLKESVLAYSEHLRAIAAGRSGDEEGDLNLTRERALLVREQREGHELKNAERKRELIPAAEVARGWADILRDVRAGALAVPSRIRQLLPHMTAHDVEVIDREIRDMLKSLADE